MKFKVTVIVIASLILYVEAGVLKEIIQQIKENVNTRKQGHNFDKVHNPGGDLDKYLKYLERENNKNKNNLGVDLDKYLEYLERENNKASYENSNDLNKGIENFFDIDIRFNGDKDQEVQSYKKYADKTDTISENEESYMQGVLKRIGERTKNAVELARENIDGIRDRIFGISTQSGKQKSQFSDREKIQKNFFDTARKTKKIPLEDEKQEHNRNNDRRKYKPGEGDDKKNEQEIEIFSTFPTRNHSKRRGDKTESMNQNSKEIKESKRHRHDSDKESEQLENNVKHGSHEKIHEIDDMINENGDIKEVITVEEDQDVENFENRDE